MRRSSIERSHDADASIEWPQAQGDECIYDKYCAMIDCAAAAAPMRYVVAVRS